MTVTVQDPQLAEDKRLAEDHYDRSIHATIRPQDEGKFVAIAVQSGDFEVDDNDMLAVRRLQVRRPGERLWLMRTGKQPATVLRSPRLLRP